MADISLFVDRYINIRKEPDIDKRRAAGDVLWHEDAHHLARTLESVGHDNIKSRLHQDPPAQPL